MNERKEVGGGRGIDGLGEVRRCAADQIGIAAVACSESMRAGVLPSERKVCSARHRESCAPDRRSVVEESDRATAGTVIVCGIHADSDIDSLADR